MLKLVGIKKDYKVANTKVHALKGVNLCFRENEFVGILGQSGCGKTTMLNIIGGLDHYTEGDLVIEGKSTKDFSDRDWDVYRNHRIGFIFQSYNLIPHQTVLGNVELALTIAGISREERIERAKQALEKVGLGNEINKRPNQLSGGQMQRVAIARALVNNPTILLADEPTGALDSKTSVEVMELIREIAGERLVIMVTHNPELAEEYATRIVRLKDGEVESDSNPYSEEEEDKERLAKDGEPAFTEGSAVEDAPSEIPVKKKKERKPRAKMGVFSALALSFRNLLTKKGRTILTSIGGSIGIISVCLVLALSNGFNHYIKKTEEDMLSYYPVQVTESSMDMAAVMTSFTSPKDMPDMSQIDDKIYVDSFLTGLANKMQIHNSISDQYLDYIGKMDRSYYAEIQYGYGASITSNLYTDVTRGGFDAKKEVDNGDGTTTSQVIHIDESTEYYSLTKLKAEYITRLQQFKEEYAELTGFADFFGNIINKMPGTSQAKLNDKEHAAEYVLSQYDMLDPDTMHFPTNENEAVLVVSPQLAATDLTLAQLGILTEKEFIELFDKGKPDATEEQKEPLYIDYERIMNKEYVLYYNDYLYSRKAVSPSDPYAFAYKSTLTENEWNKAIGEEKNKEGIHLKITAILTLKDGLSYGCLPNGLNITEAAVDHYVADAEDPRSNINSEIVKWAKEEASPVSYPVAGSMRDIFLPPCNSNEAGQFSPYYLTRGELVRFLGGDSSPTAISFYARDFDGKEKMLDYLNEWNEMCENGVIYQLEGQEDVKLGEEDKIKYTDTVGMLMSMVQTMLNAITYVLVAFTGISLIVSSVMIGIITYVSVVERVKEIGVLRSLGARKQDIRNLFNAETFMIGLSAGVLGVVVSYLLCFVVNAILNPLTGIAGLASLSPVAALVMVGISVVLTLISGLIPASAAAKKDPVIALRTE